MLSPMFSPRLVILLACAAGAAACGSPPPVEAPKEEPAADTAKTEKTSAGPAIEYDLGPVDPSIWKKKVESLKSGWNDCYSHAHDKVETLEGKLSFTVRTNKDGSVKWAYVKDADLGSRVVEKCIMDSIKAENLGPPMDAKEGEIQSHNVGWELDGDAHRAADPGTQGSVLPSIEKAKGKIDSCRNKASAKGKMTATLYIAKGGKPLSVGLAIDDPTADGAIDCVVDVLMGLKYTNKASWPTKVTVQLP